MPTIEEKITLLEELGMTRRAAVLRDEVAADLEIKKLTDMKFKIISMKEIKAKLESWHWAKGDDWTDGECLVLMVLGIIAAVAIIAASTQGAGLFALPLALLPLAAWGQHFLRWRKTKIESKSLDEWNEKLPYGALLAIREAKEKGIGAFDIYFPVKNEFRLPDPIIVGRMIEKPGKKEACASSFCGRGYHSHDTTTYGKKMIEIFSWDDGKVYESA